MMVLKCCNKCVRKFGNFSSGHRTGKGQFSFQSQRKAMAKIKLKKRRLRRGSRNTLKNYTKEGLNDPDNHDGVVTHLEPDILECEVKWALESITMN